MRYLSDLHDGDTVKEVYLCKQFQKLVTKAGKTYYSMMLQDKTGTLDAKVWDMGPGIANFDSMDFIMIEGQVTVFQGANQLNCRRVRVAQEGEYLPSDYMPTTDKDIEVMYKELTSYIVKVREPHYRELLNHYFVEDKEFTKKFKMHSAAKNVHHSFVGGLLEHTLSVVQVCDFYAEHYKLLNRDLLLTAAMCHDIGKLSELSAFPENDYTDDGNLLGHIFIGAQMVSETMRAMTGFPEKRASELVHCILAHHGELEYGSPKKPCIPEALALHMADNIDAKMETFAEMFASANLTSDWLGYQRLFESNIRRSTD